MQIVDTHQHLWDLDLFDYSWLASLPTLNRSFRMNDYLTAAKGLNVVKSVHLEADVDEPYMLDETRHLLALADQPDNPLEGSHIPVTGLFGLNIAAAMLASFRMRRDSVFDL